eukprot:4050094-Prymnesium_polylepis.1
MELAARGDQPTGAEPRVAAAAGPHKRQAVAAATAVGAAGGVGGKRAAGDGGRWRVDDAAAQGSSSRQPVSAGRTRCERGAGLTGGGRQPHLVPGPSQP